MTARAASAPQVDARRDCPSCRRPWGQHTTRESRACRARARGASLEEVLAIQTAPPRPPPATAEPAQREPFERPRGAPAPLAAQLPRSEPTSPPVPGHTFETFHPRPRTIDAASRGLAAADVRAWARQQGIVVEPRGRLSRPLIEAYEAAHGLGEPAPSTLEQARSGARSLQRFTLRELCAATGLNLHTARDRVAQLEAIHHEVISEGRRQPGGAQVWRWHECPPGSPPLRPAAPPPEPQPAGPPDALESLHAILLGLSELEVMRADPVAASLLAALTRRAARAVAARRAASATKIL